ncbi:MAG: GNAT family N-acetyltransferase [Enterobacterales bacterium]|nr:GNAT family N-acetyltransferase [Enterobacterales bacterium]
MDHLSAPCPITAQHRVDDFFCGVGSLDHWLKQKALANEQSRASRTYVLTSQNNQVVGYYALATASIVAHEAPRKIKRNMPDPVPAMVLGRLAIDLQYQGKRLGDALLRDAILRVLQAAEIAGIKAILVHAISEKAKQFYLDRSFIPSPIDPMTLFLPLLPLINER